MMCKQHLADASSCIGVCSSCLRERLFVVIAAEVQAQTDAYYKHYHFEVVPTNIEDHRDPDNNSLSRTNSDTTSEQFHDNSIHKMSDHQRFYSNPQIGPDELTIDASTKEKEKKKKNSYGLSLLSRLFRSRSKKSDLNSGVSNSQMVSLDEKSCHNQHRGMSPSRLSKEDEHCLGGSNNGVSLDTLRKTPPARRMRGKSCHNRSLSFCLSPLVRASPSRQWNQKGMTLDMMILSDKNVSTKSATSLWKNRSRKIADFGKFNLHR